METQEKKVPLKALSHGRRNAKFFDITGHTLVHPMSYNMQWFQKQIIMTAVFRNTLISLPSGLGMPYLASIIVFNFQRWFLNGKIVVLSQTKSCIVEQINAYNSYTTLSNDSYSDLYGNASATDNEEAWNKPIILSTPVKFLDSIQTKLCSVNDLVLLIIYETNKISKCQEYKDIMTLLEGLEFRVNVFIEGGSLNTKSIKQIIETFHISQIEFRNLTSPDIKDCTFRSDIESVSLEISPHMVSIKDAFFAVFEKYGKLLKDAKVINGNVVSFTKNQVQKAREKLIKTPPQNMNKEMLQNLLDGMTMCSFLCAGIEILHNWGVRSFYNYLFDEDKDAELKRLIVKDELLKTQMKLLNEYLKLHGKKMETLMSRIVHPKLIYLKNLILRSFSEAEGIIEDFRIVIYASMDEIIDDVDRLISSLPNFIRHQCVLTKSKSLSNTNDYKEVVQNFNGGVINVLALNNLVDEFNDLKTNLIVSLEPNKPLLKFSDPRFYRGADKCFFILTKGNEYQKFEALLNEKKNEQKSIDLPVVDHILQDSPALFPEGFNPDFESTSVGPLVHKPEQLSQKTMLNYLKSENEIKSRKSVSAFDDSDFVDASIFVSKNALRKSPPSKRSRSPSFFENTDVSRVNATEDIENCDGFDEQLYPSPQPVPYPEQINSKASRDEDSCDDLILDFAVPPRNKPQSKPAQTEERVESQSSDKENFSVEFIEDTVSKSTNDMNHNKFEAAEPDTVPSIISKLQMLRNRAANLPLDINKSVSSEEAMNSNPVSKCSSLFDLDDDFFKDFHSPVLNEKPKEDTLLESFKNDSRLNKNSRSSIDMVNAIVQHSPMFQKNPFREITLFGNSSDDVQLDKNSRTSIDVVNDTNHNSASLQKNRFKEVTLFESSKDDTSNRNSRTSIDVVNDTRPDPIQKHKFTSKETTLFGNSKNEISFGEYSPTSINMVNDTRPDSTQKQKFTFKKAPLFGNTRNETSIGKNSRTSIDMVDETSRKSMIFARDPFKKTSIFENSNNDTQLGANSRTSIDMVDATRQNPKIFNKNPFKEATLFGSSKNDIQSSTSIDMVEATRQNPTIFSKNPFKKATLFESSKNDAESETNSRTSIDAVNDTTRPNPFSAKSSIFSAKTTIQLTKSNQVSLKDRSASIHFDSSFDLDDDFTVANLYAEKPTEEPKSPEFSSRNNPVESNRSDNSSQEDKDADDKLLDVANVVDWDPDCELFQDDELFDNIVTPPKEPVSVKTSTPIAKPNTTPIESSPITNTQIIDLVSPQKKLVEQTKPTSSSTSTELPKPNRSLKNFTTDTCDINISDNCRKKAISNAFFSNFSSSLKEKSRRSQNAAATKRCRIDDESDDFPWMQTNVKPPEKAKLKTSSNDVETIPWLNSPVKPAASWLKKSPVESALPSGSDSSGSIPWLKKSQAGPTPSTTTNTSGGSWLKKNPVDGAFSATSTSPNAPIPCTSSSVSKGIYNVANRAYCSTSSSPSIVHSTPDFKKPSPFVFKSSTSRSAHSSSGSDPKSTSDGSTPEMKIVKNKKKKINLKRNLAKQFLDDEAAVSSDNSDDTSPEDQLNMYENDSFIDDEATNKRTNYSDYLKSIKSPGTKFGKFHIPVLSESKLRMNVCSQMDYFDHTYQQDSFCVEDVDHVEQDPEYIPSVLTQMEHKLSYEKTKTKRLQTVSSNENSSEDENSTKPTVHHKKKHRKRIMCFSSSDSDDAKS